MLNDKDLVTFVEILILLNNHTNATGAMTPPLLEEWRVFSPRSAEQRESERQVSQSRWLQNGFKVPPKSFPRAR